jgi:DMATS type aromatic prenyltransferase
MTSVGARPWYAICSAGIQVNDEPGREGGVVQSQDREPFAAPTLHDLGATQLAALCAAAGLEPREPLDLLQRLMQPWGAAPIAQSPPWPSVVADDHTPFEFSLSLGSSPEVRVLVEPLGSVPSRRANRAVAVALLESLERDFDLDLARLETVSDLFLSANPRGRFGIGVAVSFSAARPPQFKVYLDAAAQGPPRAAALIEEALDRLGLGSSWPLVTQGLLRRGDRLDELRYLSLDLVRSPAARVKVYARHHRSTVADLEAAASVSSSYRAGDVTGFLRTMAPEIDRFGRRAPLTCYAFVNGPDRRPASVTTHLPVGSYAPDDATIADRVICHLESRGVSAAAYARSLVAHAHRPLRGGVGLQTCVSLAQNRAHGQLTIYLAAEAYAFLNELHDLCHGALR